MGGGVIYGPCPFCDAWQVQVDDPLDRVAMILADEVITEHVRDEHPVEYDGVMRRRRKT